VARKYKGNMNGQRYMANTSPYKREIHDLDNESRNCLIDEIIRIGQDRPFETVSQATSEDYRPCPYCLEALANRAA
jgi:hypothetical protein